MARCVARMARQTARAPMHEIECVERLALDSLMRELRAVELMSADRVPRPLDG